MYHYYSNQFQKQVIVLNPGEYYAASEAILLSTVLGSCVAVLLFDESNHRGGMNHFMLPGRERGGNIDNATGDSPSESRVSGGGSTGGKYGYQAMQLLFDRMYALGSNKHNLKAKVFGGGAVLHLTNRNSINIPESNVRFALDYLREENIPVIATDVYGNQGRKLFFDPQTFRVHVKRLTPQAIQPVVQEEKKILQNLDKL